MKLYWTGLQIKDETMIGVKSEDVSETITDFTSIYNPLWAEGQPPEVSFFCFVSNKIQKLKCFNYNRWSTNMDIADIDKQIFLLLDKEFENKICCKIYESVNHNCVSSKNRRRRVVVKL